jgi:NTP pyrophosphatase (non-canonical NTP hydrolase)
MSHPSFSDLEIKVIQWAEARRIIPNSTPTAQLFKAVSEMGELCDAHLVGDRAKIVDGVGDVLVCLINFCALNDLDMTACLQAAYDDIKDRKGTLLPTGVFQKASA